jgi:TolB protein
MRLIRFLVPLVLLAGSPVTAQQRLARQMTEGASSSRGPTWSPDGTRIAFESDRTGDWDLYVLELWTGAVTSLTTSGADDRYPSWSPDGDRLVFVSDRDGEANLYVIDISSREARRVARVPGKELFPAWSPDGLEIAFSRRLLDSFEILSVRFSDSVLRSINEDDEIYLLNLSSGDIVRLTNRSGHDFCPAWNPGGDRLVLASVEANGARSLRVLDTGGAEVMRLAQGYYRVTEPSWSPDGDFIAFAGIPFEGDSYQVFVEPVP